MFELNLVGAIFMKSDRGSSCHYHSLEQ